MAGPWASSSASLASSDVCNAVAGLRALPPPALRHVCHVCMPDMSGALGPEPGSLGRSTVNISSSALIASHPRRPAAIKWLRGRWHLRGATGVPQCVCGGVRHSREPRLICEMQKPIISASHQFVCTPLLDPRPSAGGECAVCQLHSGHPPFQCLLASLRAPACLS